MVVNTDWLIKIEQILSKEVLEIKKEGNKYISDFDRLLSLLSANDIILNVDNETKRIILVLIQILEIIKNFAKAIVITKDKLIHNTILICIKTSEDELILYYNPSEKTIVFEEDLRLLNEAYVKTSEAFKVLARQTIYILLAGLEEKQHYEQSFNYEQTEIQQ